MDIPWEDVRLFLAVAEAGSVSRAAKVLGLGQPTVSRRLAELEYRLGYPLFARSVSGVAVTSAGERLLPAAKRMAEWAGEIARAAEPSTAGVPTGTVRIAAAPGVAFDLVAPFAAWLRERHPELRVEALCSTHYLDLARGEADLALRWRPSAAAPSEDLVTVATLDHPNAAFVSKAYAQKLGRRRYGFADIDWLAWAPPFHTLPPNPQLESLVPGFRPVFTSDNFLVLFRAMEAGLGAMVLGDVRHRFERPSEKVPLKLDLGPHARSQLHLVCAKRALDIPRVRIVAELLAEELARAGQRTARA